MIRVTTVVLFACLVAGCTAVPEVLQVESSFPGTYWEVVRVEGPCAVQGSWQETKDNAVVTHDVKATVWEVDMRLRGWGRLMPWAWFAAERACKYLVTWKTHRSDDSNSEGVTAVLYWEPVTGALTSPEVVDELLIGGNGEEGFNEPHFGSNKLKEAREILLSHARSPGAASD